MTALAASLPEEEFTLPPDRDVESAQPNPIAGVARAMRGRWKRAFAAALASGAALGAVGYLSGVQLYESQAILRVFPQESNILYATGDDSVLRTFDSFVRAETSYVASHPVMSRAAEYLAAARPDRASDVTRADITGAVSIRRANSLIVLTTLSQEPRFATDVLESVVSAYMALNDEADQARSSVRLVELHDREEALAARLTALRADQLEIGGEFGMGAISRAHVEKISQIDELATRLAEIEAALGALESGEVGSSVDGADQEIMRATLLDDTIGALGTQRAQLLRDLASLRADYAGRSNPRYEQREQALMDEVNVVEEALSDRREQIRVLAQTGALTDTPAQSEEQSLAELRNLRQRIADQLAAARLEARDLNRRRIDLDRVTQEIAQAEELLGETRRALEVIRLESGRALPGYTVLMSPPSEPVDPAEDSRKMMAAGGFAGGAALALVIVLGLGLSERRIRFAETLTPVEQQLPVLQVSAAGDADPDAADRLRNEVQLHPLRRPRLVGKAPVIAVVRAGGGSTSDLAGALAESYARSRMRTLLIEADLTRSSGDASDFGWSDILSGHPPVLPDSRDEAGFWVLSAGTANAIDDRAVSAPMVRDALDQMSRAFDVIVVSAGSLAERLSSRFVLSTADVGVVGLCPSDCRNAVLSQADRLDALPRNGSVAVMRNALPGDPWLAVRT